eukprot:1602456-Alexandrium_andersonii.AAC.1
MARPEATRKRARALGRRAAHPWAGVSWAAAGPGERLSTPGLRGRSSMLVWMHRWARGRGACSMLP